VRRVPREAIEQAVVQVFGVGQEDLRRITRGRAKVALARQVAMYLAHVVCGLTLTDTGRLFGRDRTTVAHACCVIEDRRDDPLFDRALDLLEWVVPAITTRFPASQHPSS
jgi:chromosomal replication initiation ATPase DnaA